MSIGIFYIFFWKTLSSLWVHVPVSRCCHILFRMKLHLRSKRTMNVFYAWHTCLQTIVKNIHVWIVSVIILDFTCVMYSHNLVPRCPCSSPTHSRTPQTSILMDTHNLNSNSKAKHYLRQVWGILLQEHKFCQDVCTDPQWQRRSPSKKCVKTSYTHSNPCVSILILCIPT